MRENANKITNFTSFEIYFILHYTPEFEHMEDNVDKMTFLGLNENPCNNPDVAILPIPYELTTSFGQGTEFGPAACIEVSSQVELYDPCLPDELPAGFNILTVKQWESKEGTLLSQLDSIVDYLRPWISVNTFPLILGGEHGMLPAILYSLNQHPLVNSLDEITLIQIDAHADLRNELDGEKWSHACAAKRSLDVGIGNILQFGIRAYSKEEELVFTNNKKVETFLARDILSPSNNGEHWINWLNKLSTLKGPIWITLDIDGLDGNLVPATGTPVPGGLYFWQVIETLEKLFENENTIILGTDINEIVPDKDTPLTQFTAAMLATKTVALHLSTKHNKNISNFEDKQYFNTEKCNYFQNKG